MKLKLLYLLFFVTSVSYAQIPTNGIIAQYDLDNGSLVDAANGANFTQTGSSLTQVNDRFLSSNLAVSLNGDYLTRANINYPNVATQQDVASISFWIRTSTDDANIRTIIDDTSGRSSQTDTQWEGVYVYLRDGNIGATLRTGFQGNASTTYRGAGKVSNTKVSDGNWHHVVVAYYYTSSFTGASDIYSFRVKLYVDGVHQGDGTGSGSISLGSGTSFRPYDTNASIRFGKNASSGFTTTETYLDEIDEVNIYGRVLTEQEITQIATRNNFCFPPLPSTITESDITQNSFNVAWTEDGTFDLAYVPTGTPFSSATIQSNINYTSGNKVAVTGLQPSTIYKVYLRKDCGGSSKSNWSLEKEVRTNGRLYVNVNATGNNDGTSWTNAYIDLQSALAVAVDSQEIWIAKGTYKADASDPTVSFEVTKNGMKLYGGFSGTESDILQRNIASNQTILSGDLNGDDTGVDYSGVNRTDNTNNIIKLTANNIYFDGLIISDGHSTTSGSHSAAIRLMSNNLNGFTMVDCTVKNNVADLAAFTYLRNETAFSSSSNMKLVVKNSIIENNLSRYGTIYVNDARVNNRVSTIEVVNTLFKDNEAKDRGTSKGYFGSVAWIRSRATSAGSATLASKFINCSFVNNKDLGTATNVNNFNRSPLVLEKNSNVFISEVTNSIFWGNEATGGIASRAISSGTVSDYGTLSVYNSIANDDFTNLASADKTNTSNNDPLFTDAANNDFTLQATSPAIDSGDNSKLPLNTLTDLLGNVRIFNTTVDLGVYELGAGTPGVFTLSKNATNGSVTNDPNGSSFVQATVVELTAVPDAGYVFSEWTGDVTGTSNPVNVTMDANKSVTAVFVKTPKVLTITSTNGSVATNPNPTNGAYDDGTSVTLTATPDAGYQFDSWSGDATGATNPLTITMDSDKNITATFVEKPIFVDVNATGNNDGTSWADAYTDLQTAMNAGANSKEVWVAKGTYKPTGSGRNATFTVGLLGEVYGGFAGTETKLSERDMNLIHTTNATILSGDLNGDDNANLIPAEATRQDNAYHVLTVKRLGGGNLGFLDGFIIQDGNANGSLSNSCSTSKPSQYDHRGGAGINAHTGNVSEQVRLVLKNSIVRNNTATNYAVFNRFNPCGASGTQVHMDFESCIIKNNYSSNTANIAFSGSQQYSIRAFGKITNSLIAENTTGAADEPSALFIKSSGTTGSTPASDVTVTNTTIANNSSTNNMAVEIDLKSASSYPVRFYNSILYNNGGTSSIAVLGTNGASATFANNIVQGGHYSQTDADPLLRSDYRLLTGSPALDSGDNTKVPGALTKDLGGQDRIQNTTVDLGAYEGVNQTLTFALTINTTNGSVSTNPNPTNGTYDDGTSVTLTATPDAGYEFVEWSGDASGTTNPLIITMDADKTITATFAPIQRTLTVNATNGAVTTDPNPTNGTYDDGTSVTLTATPDAGYEFVEWSGDASGTTNPLIITMDADKTITATFAPIQRTLTVNATNGAVTTNPNPTNGTYDDGTSVTLTATPDAGYEFVEWSGDASGTTNPLIITMDADKTITATFAPIQRTLTVNATNGIVTTNPNPTNGTYDDGTSVTLTATPDAGYEFVEWSGDASGTTNPLIITMDADKTITATFAPIQRTLTITAIDGSVTTSPNPVNGTYDQGTVVTLTAVPDSGFSFDAWSGDATGTTTQVTITMDSDKNVTATFSATLGVNEDKFKVPFKLYPNPVTDVLRIESQEVVHKVKIYNTLGKEVLFKNSFDEETINVSNLSQGIYFMIIETETGKGVRRFIKM
ncbi:hypothetical protein BTO06_01460 [Tenacibaculum sp. SZ-18]|uniref:InlB B-repeat-containing protein n=1 Tax=Tenacibaculum sp. SZ-18 TaxID=754423 RepID=UPI000C2D3A4F|nr:choice-of-anchor Q domain-containing protein [Tenacibaculum sp. SZ-18]AUC13900.1 hypothetical protein BTO06_01460 [Tenacibaculum sp. SZ-18]